MPTMNCSLRISLQDFALLNTGQPLAPSVLLHVQNQQKEPKFRPPECKENETHVIMLSKGHVIINKKQERNPRKQNQLSNCGFD